jgi:hypothetical protein
MNLAASRVMIPDLAFPGGPFALSLVAPESP